MHLPPPLQLPAAGGDGIIAPVAVAISQLHCQCDARMLRSGVAMHGAAPALCLGAATGSTRLPCHHAGLGSRGRDWLGRPWTAAGRVESGQWASRPQWRDLLMISRIELHRKIMTR